MFSCSIAAAMPRFIRPWAIVTGMLFVEVLGPSACAGDDASTILPPSAMGRDPDRNGAGGSDATGPNGEAGGAVDAGTAGSNGAAGQEDDGPVAQGSGAGGAPTASADDGGLDEPEGGSNQPAICIRLVSPSALSFDVTRSYEQRVFADCRINWVTRLYLDLDERAQFFNRLLAWNLNFWGCAPPAPTDFALIHRPVALTTADAQTIIEHYLVAANNALRMSGPERDQMRAALAMLAAPLVDTTQHDYSQPACPADAGPADAEDGTFEAAETGDEAVGLNHEDAD
jgi:hypothetical protein